MVKIATFAKPETVIWESKKGLGQSSPIWVIFFFYCLEALKNQQRQ